MSKQIVALIKVALLTGVILGAAEMYLIPNSHVGQSAAQTGIPIPRIDFISLNRNVTNGVTINQGESVIVSVQATNIGTVAGDRGAIYISFPEFGSYNDADYVDLLSSSDDLVYHEYRPAGSSDPVWYACGSAGHLGAAQALLVKGQESSSLWEPGEANFLEVKVTLWRPGISQVYVKAVMRNGSDGSYHFDPTTGTYTDQQCEYVYRRTIEVVAGSNTAYLPVVGKNHAPAVHGVRMQASGCSGASVCDERLDCLQAAGINVLYYDIHTSQAYYSSALLPHRTFDSLAYLVPRAHAHGMKVYALINVALIGWRQHPEWNARLNHRGVTEDWLDFEIPEARDFVADVAEELVTNYGVDGILLDYIRWRVTDFAAADLSADDITKTVEGVYRRVRAISPVPVTASVLVDYDTGRIAGQMWYDWLDAGIMDYVTPMAYVNDNYLRTLLREWGASAHWPRRIIPRLATAWFDPEESKPVADVLRQMDMCYDAGAAGITLWDDRYICKNPDLVEALSTGWQH